MISGRFLVMIVMIHLEESASHPSPSPRGSAPSCFCQHMLALRVSLAVTWLTVYRQLNIPAEHLGWRAGRELVSENLFVSLNAHSPSVSIA